MSNHPDRPPLADALLSAARTRGWNGDDAHEALAALLAPDPLTTRLGAAVSDLWLSFFSLAHADEQLGQLLADPQVRAEVDALNRRLGSRLPGSGFDIALATDLLLALEHLWQVRHAGVGNHPGDSVNLQGSGRDQECAELTRVIDRTAEAMALPPADPLTRLMGICAWYQGELDRIRSRYRDTADVVTAMMAGLRAAAAGQPLPPLPPEVATLIQPLVREPVRPEPRSSEPPPPLSRPPDVAEMLVELDRDHERLVEALVSIHRVSPLPADPSRHRRRGLLGLAAGSRRNLPGLASSFLAAIEDLWLVAEIHHVEERADVLRRQAPAVGAVFGELVRLVALWRERLGDPPPRSLSLSLNGGEELVGLPLAVAEDLAVVLRRRQKAGPACQILAPVLDASVGIYHRALMSVGIVQQVRAPSPAREGVIQRVERLTDELARLAGLCEAWSARSRAVGRGVLDAVAERDAACASLQSAAARLTMLPDMPARPEGAAGFTAVVEAELLWWREVVGLLTG